MKFIALLLPFILLACSSSQEKSLGTEVKFEENLTIGKDLKASRYSDIFFSAQPTMDDIKELKKQGFTHIVNLRAKNEYNEKEERDTIVKEGISYTIAPFKVNKPVSDKYLDYINRRVGKHRSKGKTLIHCSSGERVATWAGIHFFRDHKYSQDAALVIAKKIGLTKPELTKTLTDYTSKNAEEAPSQEDSEEDENN